MCIFQSKLNKFDSYTNRNHFWDMMTSSSQDENDVCASPAQPPGYKEILNCDNPEDFANHLNGVRAHFDNVRQLYLKFMNEMGVSSNFSHL